jgi:hypothetical protein
MTETVRNTAQKEWPQIKGKSWCEDAVPSTSQQSRELHLDINSEYLTFIVLAVHMLVSVHLLGSMLQKT